MIIFFVTFTLFFLEALLHYNYGKGTFTGSVGRPEGAGEQFHFPDQNEIVQIIITVGIFSFLNSYIIRILTKRFHLH